MPERMRAALVRPALTARAGGRLTKKAPAVKPGLLRGRRVREMVIRAGDGVGPIGDASHQFDADATTRVDLPMGEGLSVLLEDATGVFVVVAHYVARGQNRPGKSGAAALALGLAIVGVDNCVSALHLNPFLASGAR